MAVDVLRVSASGAPDDVALQLAEQLRELLLLLRAQVREQLDDPSLVLACHAPELALRLPP